MVFFAVVLLAVGLIHFYLWKRLVRDPLRPGLGRRAGTVLAVVLCALAPLTLIGVRAGYFQWLSWPGYLWIAMMFYLLVVLLVLEIPRLLTVRLWAGSGRTAGKARTAAEQAAAAPAATDVVSVPAQSAALATASGDDPPTASVHENDRGGSSTNDRGRGSTYDQGRGSARDRDGSSANDPSESTARKPAESENKPAESEPAEKQGIERRLLIARGTAIFAGLTAAGITGYGVKTATGAPQIDRVRIPIAKLPRAMDGTRLAVVSDIHIGPLTGVDHARRIVQVINSVDADLVCVVGDLVDGSVAELGRFAAPLAGIESRHGAFFVTGNHEYYSGVEEWVDEVARLGIRPLRNERIEINGLDLAGVNDLTGEQQGDAPDFARALGDRDTSRPVVLMAHQPVAAREAAPYGVDLQVSGHTHGGQMAPFNMLVKLQQPVVSGFGEVDGVPVYVTNGAGFWGPPVRVGAPPQVTVIELRVA
ncbi:metallophosphoesterase [Actinoplanes sp. NPDC023801]|uniref:metallophosphoesterase n=1 Tax=Actinoplanes sp. NPDC023801 TaxID=3154595 RepID=UPI0033DEC909